MAEVNHFYDEENSLGGTSASVYLGHGAALTNNVLDDHTKYLVIARALLNSDDTTDKLYVKLEALDDLEFTAKSEAIYEMQQIGASEYKSYFFVHSFITDHFPGYLSFRLKSDGGAWSYIDQSSILCIDLDDLNGASQDTYYFNASDAGPVDSDSAWTGDANAFDGSITTDALADSVQGGKLTGDGTNAPTSGNRIDRVQVRVYGLDSVTDNILCQVKEDSASGTDLSGPYPPSVEGWSKYFAVTPPAGGWTWQKVNDLSITFWNAVPAAGQWVSCAEVLVTSCTEDNYIEDINAATGTEISDQELAATQLATIASGDTDLDEWMILGYAKIGVGSTGVNFNVTIQTADDSSASSIVNNVSEEGEDTAEERMVGVVARHQAVTTAVTIRLKAWEDAGNGNMTDQGSYLIALKASAFADFEYDYDSGTVGINSTESTVASVGPYTPTTNGNHVIIGRVGKYNDSDLLSVHLEDGTTETRTGDSTPTHNQNWDIAKDFEPAFTMQRISISAEKTYNLRAVSTGTGMILDHRWLLVLNLNKYQPPTTTTYPPFPRRKLTTVRM